MSDVEERFDSLRSQNKELKQLMIKKENQINDLMKGNYQLERQLGNLLDPNSSTSLLKQKYRNNLKVKEEKINKLENEHHEIMKKVNLLQEEHQSLSLQKNDIDSNNSKKLDDEKATLEARKKKAMEDYARELSIRYANCEPADTTKRLKDAISGLKKANRNLDSKIKKGERSASANNSEKQLAKKIKELESKF